MKMDFTDESQYLQVFSHSKKMEEVNPTLQGIHLMTFEVHGKKAGCPAKDTVYILYSTDP